MGYPFEVEKGIEILQKGKRTKIVVIGDYCLDKYLFIDASLDEPSVETGLTAYQVRRKGIFPGAAGTVVNNLAALGAEVHAIGIYGDDGEGYELIQALRSIGADIRGMIRGDKIMTSTYMKPIREEKGDSRELNRLDLRNGRPAPTEMMDEVKKALEAALPDCRGVVISDQFTRQAGSVLGGDLPDFLGRLAEKYRETFFMADSRSNAGQYRNVLVKCNASELLDLDRRLDNPEVEASVDADPTADAKLDAILNAGKRLARRNNRPVLVTRGALGALLFEAEKTVTIPAVPVAPPIDICGAGDATNAGLTFARSLGIPLPEAALIAGIVSSITIRQIGVTGTAHPDEVRRILETFRE